MEKDFYCIACESKNVDYAPMYGVSFEEGSKWLQCKDCNIIFKNDSCINCNKLFGNKDWCGSSVNFHFGYGSPRDGDYGKFNFCSDCSEEVLSLITGKFPNVKLKSQF